MCEFCFAVLLTPTFFQTAMVIEEGSTAFTFFLCTNRNHPSVSAEIVWFNSDNELLTVSDSYIFPMPIQLEHGGMYRCEVTSLIDGSTAHATVMLVVTMFPSKPQFLCCHI